MLFTSLTSMASSWSSLSFCVFTLLSILSMASSTEDDVPPTIIIPLKSRFTKNPSTDPMLFFQQLASASSARLQYLRHGKKRPSLRTPIFPLPGGHYVDLSFGTPPQTFSMLLDTGSDVLWFPCTNHYRCINCSSNGDNEKIPIFNPKLSSSSKVLHCRSPKCVDPNSQNIPSCRRCNDRSKRCPQDCPYNLHYAIGATTGYFLLEDLKFPGKTFHNFLVGCTTSSEGDSIATAGFGNTIYRNTPLSLPLQMGAKKFAYCLKSHDFDDTGKSSKLFIDYNSGDTKGLSYTPFLNNTDYYYLSVEGIMIGDKLLRIPRKYIAPGSNGTGGVIIDSGFTTGYMARPVYNIVSAELKRQMSKYRRSFEAERLSGYSPCYNFTGEKSIKIPDLVYKFENGARMAVAGENYLEPYPAPELWCFPVSTDDTGSLDATPGPSIILGNYQQVDFYVEFDLKNNRFGFRKQTC